MRKQPRKRKIRCDGCKTVLCTIIGTSTGGTANLELGQVVSIKVISLEKCTHLITCRKCGHATNCVIPFSIYKERVEKARKLKDTKA